MTTVTLRPSRPDDAPRVAAIARVIVDDGSTYSFGADTPDDELVAYFIPDAKSSFVAVRDGNVVGCAVIRPNRLGRGAHVANGSYIVDPSAHGGGIGRALGEHSLGLARSQGFRAIQFNFVVSTNERAVNLWRSLGFSIVGTLPQAFQHPTLGLVDAYVMHRFL